VCIRDDEVKLLGASEVAETGVVDAGGFVRRDDVVPRAHLRSCRGRRVLMFFPENPRRMCKERKLLGTVCFLPSFH
jgi:hypothetical protein